MRSCSRLHSLWTVVLALAPCGPARGAPLHPCAGSQLSVESLAQAPEATQKVAPTKVQSVVSDVFPRQMVQVTKVASIGGRERLITSDRMNRVYIQDIQTGEMWAINPTTRLFQPFE